MRYLIDTNIFVYMSNDPDSLDRDVRAIVEDYDSVLYLSTESMKELVVAYRNKGLLSNYWQNEGQMISFLLDSQFVLLPVKPEHIKTYAEMQINEAQGHKDPSDHVIIAQAITENMPLISSDKRFEFYRTQGLDLIQNHK